MNGEVQGDDEYAIWYQCKTCINLFYDAKFKIDEHLQSDAHKLNCINKHLSSQQQVQHPKVTTSNRNIRRKTSKPKTLIPSANNGLMTNGLPLRIKESHLMWPKAPKSPSVSPGLNKEELKSPLPEKLHQNVQYISKVPRTKMDKFNFYKNNPHLQNKCRPRSSMMNGGDARNQIGQSYLENMRQQLKNTNIEISEIKMDIPSIEDVKMHDVKNVCETEDQEMPNMSEIPSEIHQEQKEEEEKNLKDGEGEAHQSSYENGICGNFLSQNSQADNKSNTGDAGTIFTPSFGMVDELFQNASTFAKNLSTSPQTDEPPRIRNPSQSNYPCIICRNTFSSLSKLRIHAQTEHFKDVGECPHICKFCYHYFPNAATLSKHLEVHQGENPNVCNICGKSFSSSATLRTHLKIHSGERPFGCEDCKQRFQTKSTLDSHRRIHTGAKPHRCPYCDKTFRTSSPLYRHLRAVHKEVNIPVTEC